MKRFRWPALAVAWVVAVIGWIVVFAIPDTYEAQARIYVNTDSMLQQVVGGMAVAPNMAAELNVLTHAMLSRPQLEKVARATDLDLRASGEREFETLIGGLESRIQISGSRGDNLYSIGYRDNNRAMAERVVSTLLTTFVEDALGSTRSDSGAAQLFIDNQLREYEARLEEAEMRLADFKRDNVGLMPGENGDYYTRLQSAMTGLEQTRASLELAVQGRAELQRQLAGEVPVFGIFTSSRSGGSENDALISKYEAEIAELLLRFTEQHPEVRARRETIERLTVERNEQAANQPDFVASAAPDPLDVNPVYQQLKVALGAAEVEVVTLRGRLEAQQHEVDRLKSLVDTIPEIERKLTALNRDYEVTQVQYEELLQRRETVRLTEQVGQADDDVQFRIIDPPLASLEPVTPNRPLLHAVVLVGAIGAGILLAFVLNQAQPVVLGTNDLRRATGLPVLGSISLAMTDTQRRAKHVRALVFGAACASLLLALGVVVLFAGPASRLFRTAIAMVNA
jgi:polysaccharide chain length determinant protein (PEP-CTERM system associated)